MCGIFGITGKSIDILKATKSLNRLSHRGPDQYGEYSDERTYLGHRRLSILDLSENGRQPMFDDDKEVIITVNGEIYNFKKIRDALKEKYFFKSNSDSEVILYGYKEYGIEGLLEKIDGMFVFTVYDKKKGKIYLCRDRAGIKPLFYANLNGTIVWASELKALEEYCKGTLVIDNTAVYDFLTYLYIPRPKTLYKNVYKLSPAHYAEIDLNNSNLVIKKYWDIWPSETHINIDDAAEKVRHLIRKSVQEQLMSDVPVGFFLSGGIDSGIVVFEASKIRSGNNTFTIDFEDSVHSEAAYARIIAGLCETNHREKLLTEEMSMELFTSMLEWYDEPYGDTSAIPSYLVSDFAKKNVTVVLTGDGGDEIFGGYKWYSQYLKYKGSNNHFPINRFLLELRNRNRYRLPGKIANRLLNHNLQGNALYTKLLGGMIVEEKGKYRELFEIPADYDDYWYFRQYLEHKNPGIKDLMMLDFHTYLPDDILTKVDRVSMAVSLEARVPLLSRDIIEFMFSLPEEMILFQQRLKGFVKYAYKDILPDSILNREKRGFNIPVHKWPAIYSNRAQNMNEVILEKIYSGKIAGF